MPFVLVMINFVTIWTGNVYGVHKPDWFFFLHFYTIADEIKQISSAKDSIAEEINLISSAIVLKAGEINLIPRL